MHAPLTPHTTFLLPIPALIFFAPGMTTLGTPFTATAKKVMLCGSGELGKEVVIVEGFVEFDYEITMLTVRHVGGTSFCDPVGHIQVDGDYRESWQPAPMSEAALASAQKMAGEVTGNLGGYGLFGVEMFVKDDEVIFSEVSPRPHDTGMVTMISQDISQFALHARAILGLPIPNIHTHGPSASCALVVEGHSEQVSFGNLEEAMSQPDTQLRIFGKPQVTGKRRMAVTLARGVDVDSARATARQMVERIDVQL